MAGCIYKGRRNTARIRVPDIIATVDLDEQGKGIKSVEKYRIGEPAFGARLLRVEEAMQRRRQYTVVEKERDDVEQAIENLVGLA